MVSNLANDFQLSEVVKEKLDEALKDLGHLNILIIGRPGVGKSTLINAVFQGNFAPTGTGLPVNKETTEITKEGIPLSIFDTRGLEIGNPSALEDFRLFVTERKEDINPQKHIHVAWVCFIEGLRRVEPGEIDAARWLAERMPVIAIITKPRGEDRGAKGESFYQKVQELLPFVKSVLHVNAITVKTDHVTYPQSGLQELIDSTISVLPTAIRNTFIAVQKINIELKKEHAKKIVMEAAAASAFEAGAIPIPFFDALAIIPTQIWMIAKITAIFGLPTNQRFITAVIGSATGGIVTNSGRIAMAELLKFFVIGAPAVPLIEAAIATALTTAIGEAYIITLEKLLDRSNGELPTSNKMSEVFRGEYNSRTKQYQSPPKP